MTYNPIPHRSTHDLGAHIRKKCYEQTGLDKTGNGNIRGALLAIVLLAALFSVVHIIGWLSEVFK